VYFWNLSDQTIKECRIETPQPPSDITAYDRRVGDSSARFNAIGLDRASWNRGNDLMHRNGCGGTKPKSSFFAGPCSKH
jgi:hypothetical protein